MLYYSSNLCDNACNNISNNNKYNLHPYFQMNNYKKNQNYYNKTSHICNKSKKSNHLSEFKNPTIQSNYNKNNNNNKKEYKKTIECLNCGILGHTIKTCNYPITSYGIVCYYINNKKEIKYLLIQRKDSLCYIEFIRGKYDLTNLDFLCNIFKCITNKEKELIWILEHPEIFTAGTSYKENEIIDKSINLLKTNRGGKITYHGPGQLICYFVIDLRKKKDIRKFITSIENTIIQRLKKYNIETFPDKENIGIWYKDKNEIKKILGNPSTTSKFDNDIWIYIERKQTQSQLKNLGKMKIFKNDILVLEINNYGLIACSGSCSSPCCVIGSVELPARYCR